MTPPDHRRLWLKPDAYLNTDRLNRWLSLGANVGVIAGLILLILEVRHANELAELAAYRNRGAEIQEAWTALSLSPQLAEIFVKVEQGGIGALNDVERTQLRAWEFGRMSRMQNQFYDYQHGYLDTDVEEDSLMNAALALERWNELGIVVPDPDFRHVIQTKKQEMEQTSNK